MVEWGRLGYEWGEQGSADPTDGEGGEKRDHARALRL